MACAKLHVGLSVTTMLVAIALIIWVVFVNTDTIPKIHLTYSALIIFSGSNSLLRQSIQDRAKDDISFLEKQENLLTPIFSLVVVGSIIFLVRGTVLLMTVSGEDCYNCCGPVQFVWRQVRREVNMCLMETTRSHSKVDNEEDVEESPTSLV